MSASSDLGRELALQTKAAVADYLARWAGPLHEKLQALEQRVDARTTGEPGVDGRDGVDGKDADPAETKALVAEAVTVALAQMNLGGLVRDELAKALSLLPAAKDGRDGKDADPQALTTFAEPLLAALVTKAMAELPRARAPIDIVGTVIDRDGHLLITRSDGSTQNAGRVVGRDADMALVLKHAGDLIAQLPQPQNGKDGQDGVGFDDMNLVFDEKADGFLLRFTRGAEVRDVPVPLPYYKGPYVRGQFYKKGQQVSYRGVWAAMDDTYDTPGQGKTAWRLVLKDPERGSER